MLLHCLGVRPFDVEGVQLGIKGAMELVIRRVVLDVEFAAGRMKAAVGGLGSDSCNEDCFFAGDLLVREGVAVLLAIFLGDVVVVLGTRDLGREDPGGMRDAFVGVELTSVEVSPARRDRGERVVGE